MRVPVILLLALLAPASAVSDVIHLKNGRTIWAEHVRENGAKVEYDLGDDSYAVPKASVERVEAGGVPPQYPASSSAATRELPSFAPAEIAGNEDALSARVIREGKVDF